MAADHISRIVVSCRDSCPCIQRHRVCSKSLPKHPEEDAHPVKVGGHDSRLRAQVFPTKTSTHERCGGLNTTAIKKKFSKNNTNKHAFTKLTPLQATRKNDPARARIEADPKLDVSTHHRHALSHHHEIASATYAISPESHSPLGTGCAAPRASTSALRTPPQRAPHLLPQRSRAAGPVLAPRSAPRQYKATLPHRRTVPPRRRSSTKVLCGPCGPGGPGGPEAKGGGSEPHRPQPHRWVSTM